MRTTMKCERFEEFARDAEASAARDPAGRPGVPVPYLRTWNFEDDAPELSDGFPHDSAFGTFRDAQADVEAAVHLAVPRTAPAPPRSCTWTSGTPTPGSP